MKANMHPTWEEYINFPESFNWNLLDSPKTERVANAIVTAIQEDFKTDDHIFVCGLREALRLIAANIEVYEG